MAGAALQIIQRRASTRGESFNPPIKGPCTGLASNQYFLGLLGHWASSTLITKSPTC